MKKILALLISCFFITIACSDNSNEEGGKDPGIIVSDNLAEQNILRAIQLMDKAVSCHFTGDGMAMGRYYNPYTNVLSDEKGSVWMYTSSIEAVNAILSSLQAHKESGNTAIYDKHFNRYSDLLSKLYDNADYYLGTFELVSFTQTKKWSVYAVDRVNDKGGANVTGVLNVYDDQMWLVRELLHSYKLTGNSKFLEKAEYLTEYVLDGWDSTRDSEGNENGGIPWGPGYVTKHSCSNGPMVSPLVWLHELYKGKSDVIDHRYIDATDKKTRKVKTEKKSDYYLDFAKKVYDWQKEHLLRNDGIYNDMLGGCDPNCDIVYETVDGVTYRANTRLTRSENPPYSYNSGTMISGAADLYKATGNSTYLDDAKRLSDASFNYFAKLGATHAGYYSYEVSGFNNWFNGVLMRSYVDVYSSYNAAAKYIDSFQKNLDYGYSNHLYDATLPTNLLVGWNRDKGKNDTEGMFSFTFAAEYAILSQYELEK